MEGAAPVIRYNLGVALLQMNRIRKALSSYSSTSLQPNAHAENAKKLAAIRDARENYAPDFSFTSAQGRIHVARGSSGQGCTPDFWGTWCPPCVESVPELRNLHKKYSKEPSFVLIGIRLRSRGRGGGFY